MDYYCGIPYEKSASIFYTGSNIYLLPVILLGIVYARLMYFIHHQSPQLLQTQQGKKMQRDFIVMRRIVFLVNVLTVPGLPNLVLAIMTLIQPSIAGSYYMYRIQWVGAGILTFILSIALVIMTPQLKRLITIGLIYPENQVRPGVRQTMNEEHTRPVPTAGHRF